MPLPFDFSNTIIESGDAKVVTDLLFEAHYILKDILTGMKLIFIRDELTEFRDILLKLNNGKNNNDDDNLSKYIALEFKNIISSIKEDLEFKKFYYKI
jgi:hypothetical protein